MIHIDSKQASAPRSQAAVENASLLKAIGVGPLTGYFEYLDELRESGEANMYGAAPYLMSEYGMVRQEARTVLLAWQKTFSHTLPAEDRAENAIEANL